eukprot:Sspe_Gene.45027::Locus_22173_Transcript_1_2_Confidence_1.000_Length_838::g.45027::m.45027/K21806/VCPKMT, METTL21D; protein N-lysine methyltransferase METTL21D
MDDVPFRFSGDDSVDCTGARRVWDASFPLLGYLKAERKRFRWEKKRVVELGSGLGYLAAGLSMLGAEVVATEIEDMLPVLSRNLDAAMSQAKGSGYDPPRPHVHALDWRDPEPSLATLPIESVDVLVAADVVYLEKYVKPLVTTIQLILAKHPGCQVFVASEMRCPVTNQVFEDMLEEAGFSVRVIPNRRFPSDFRTEQWKTIRLLHFTRG